MVYGASLRLDKWLWYARLAKSRGCAKTMCESRRLRIDGRVVERASALVRAGQVLSFPDNIAAAYGGADQGRIVIVRVESLSERRGPFAEARLMYTDLGAALQPCSALPAVLDGVMMQQQRNLPLTGAAAAF